MLFSNPVFSRFLYDLTNSILNQIQEQIHHLSFLKRCKNSSSFPPKNLPTNQFFYLEFGLQPLNLIINFFESNFLLHHSSLFLLKKLLISVCKTNAATV